MFTSWLPSGFHFSQSDRPAFWKSYFQRPSHTWEGICKGLCRAWPCSVEKPQFRGLLSWRKLPDSSPYMNSWTWKTASTKDKSHGTEKNALQHTENQTAIINLTNRTPTETHFRIPTAVLFSYGLSRCCCQFSHQGVLRSGLFTLSFLSLWLPLTRSAASSALWLGLAAHSGKSYNQAAPRASIFQESKPTNHFLQDKLSSLSLPPPPQGRVSAVTLFLHIGQIRLYSSQCHTGLCNLGI